MIYWDNNLDTGVAIIDEDHKFLFGLINNISVALENNEENWRISFAIDALNDYAHNHFKREEALMLLCGYTSQERHEKEHDNFRDVVKSLRHLYATCPELVNLNGLIDYLNRWLKEHIAFSDHAYVEQMQNHEQLISNASKNLIDRLNL